MEFIYRNLSRDDSLNEPNYNIYMFVSFVLFSIIHHIISPYVFKKFNKIYNELSREKRMEWDSRLISSIHAITVSTLCIYCLVLDKNLWAEPVNYSSHIALLTLSFSIGYFMCDTVSMPFYWWDRHLVLFILHHFSAVTAFYFVVNYRKCTFFGLYRLTTEISTPFVNQRWFYRTIGYKPDRRRVATVTLLFAIIFIITRNLMIFPFWIISAQAFKSQAYIDTAKEFPPVGVTFISTCSILDVLNVMWGFRVCGIGFKAAKLMWNADWRTELIQHIRRKLLRRSHSIRSSIDRERLSVALMQLDSNLSDSFKDPIDGDSSTSSDCSFSEYELAQSDLNVSSAELNEESVDFVNVNNNTDQTITHRKST